MANAVQLTTKDQFLIRNAEAGYRSAAELLSWWKQQEAVGNLQKFEQSLRNEPPLTLTCFYHELQLAGRPTTAMGCLWKSRFQRQKVSSSVPHSTLHSFVNQFMRHCGWTHPDNLRGGFEFLARQYKLKGSGEYGVFAEKGPIADLAEVGQKYEWVVLEAVVHDFFRSLPGIRFGPRMLSRMPAMASYVLVHGDYSCSFHPPVEGAVDEHCFGYSFLPCPVTKSIFGHGPGKFAGAVKQFRFVLLESGDVEIQMFFLVAPRSEKILNLGGFDPVYFAVNVVNGLTLNLFRVRRRAHDKIDAFLLLLHALVYQGLLDGMRGYWEGQNWIEGFQGEQGRARTVTQSTP